VLAVATAATAAGAAQPPPTVPEERRRVVGSVERMVVRVRCAQPVRAKADGHLSLTYEYGSGVVLTTDGWIATAAHVVAPCTKTGSTSSAGVGVMGVDMAGYVAADIAAVDGGADIALLRVNPHALPHLEAVQWQGCAAPGDEALTYALGIRADAEPRAFELGIVRGSRIDRTTRIQEHVDGPKRKTEPWIAISQQILRGYSGGAILDAKACLLGLIVGAPEVGGQWTEFSYGIATNAIAKLFLASVPLHRNP
jgi:S1-C subfamily serine protease